MADEIRSAVSLALVNGSINEEKKIAQTRFTQTAAKFSRGTQTVGFAAHEAIQLNDVGTAGWFVVQNLDDTNFVSIGIDVTGTFHATIKLEPGEFASGRFAGVPYAQADTAAVELFFFICDD